MVRAGLEGRVSALPPGGYLLIAGFLDGLSLGEAAARANTASEDFNLATHLAGLLRLGALSSFHPPSGAAS